MAQAQFEQVVAIPADLIQRLTDGAPFVPDKDYPSHAARHSLLGCIGYYLHPKKSWPDKTKKDKVVAEKDVFMRKSFSHKERTANLLLGILNSYDNSPDDSKHSEYLILKNLSYYFQHVLNLAGENNLGSPDSSDATQW